MIATAEESLEMLGIIMFIFSLIDYMKTELKITRIRTVMAPEGGDNGIYRLENPAGKRF
jgi:hypothetical protein